MIISRKNWIDVDEDVVRSTVRSQFIETKKFFKIFLSTERNWMSHWTN